MQIGIRAFLWLVFLITAPVVYSQQLVEIEGTLIATDEVEGIHIINKNSNHYSASDHLGKFKIKAKLNDTLYISSIKYYAQDIPINQNIIATKTISIELKELINALDKVIVGKVLTGDLISDIENSDAEPELNFYDFGIPGYTGPRKTLAEKRLYTATSGSGLIPLFPIINAISGRTKELKARIKRATIERYVDLAMAKFSDSIFEADTEKSQIYQFFFYVSDDEKFLTLSKQSNDFKLLGFLLDKKKIYDSKIDAKDND